MATFASDTRVPSIMCPGHFPVSVAALSSPHIGGHSLKRDLETNLVTIKAKLSSWATAQKLVTLLTHYSLNTYKLNKTIPILALLWGFNEIMQEKVLIQGMTHGDSSMVYELLNGHQGRQ